MQLNGTKFQIEVWNQIKKIPKGTVKTYKEIALILNRPRSSRAVANACAKNPYQIGRAHVRQMQQLLQVHPKVRSLNLNSYTYHDEL